MNEPDLVFVSVFFGALIVFTALLLGLNRLRKKAKGSNPPAKA